MTLKEKKKRIEYFCNGVTDCDGCPLEPSGSACFTTDEPSVIDRNYRRLFETMPETVTAQVSGIVEDADTVIKIKSSKKIDNITIYFKED